MAASERVDFLRSRLAEAEAELGDSSALLAPLLCHLACAIVRRAAVEATDLNLCDAAEEAEDLGARAARLTIDASRLRESVGASPLDSAPVLAGLNQLGYVLEAFGEHPASVRVLRWRYAAAEAALDPDSLIRCATAIDLAASLLRSAARPEPNLWRRCIRAMARLRCRPRHLSRASLVMDQAFSVLQTPFQQSAHRLRRRQRRRWRRKLPRSCRRRRALQHLGHARAPPPRARAMMLTTVTPGRSTAPRFARHPKVQVATPPLQCNRCSLSANGSHSSQFPRALPPPPRAPPASHHQDNRSRARRLRAHSAQAYAARTQAAFRIIGWITTHQTRLATISRRRADHRVRPTYQTAAPSPSHRSRASRAKPTLVALHLASRTRMWPPRSSSGACVDA